MSKIKRYVCEICGKTGLGTTLKMPASFSTYHDHDVCKECCVNRRAPVQGYVNPARPIDARPPGSITWDEHEKAYAGYVKKLVVTFSKEGM